MVDTIDVNDIVNPGDVAMSARHVERARQIVHEQVTSGRSPTCAAVVLRHGKVLVAEAAGTQRPDGPPLEVDHIFAIASSGKPMTAAVLLSLAEDGLVGINDRVDTYLPEVNQDGRNDDVLLQHLFTHTAGWEFGFASPTRDRLLATEFSDPSKFEDFNSSLGLQLAVQGQKLAPAGTIMRYSNTGYECMAEIIRRVTGTTFDAAARSRLFEPLGMGRTQVICSDDMVGHHIDRAPTVPFGAEWRGGYMHSKAAHRSDGGAASVYSSPTDLARFGQMILQGGQLDGVHVLAPTTVRAMTTNQIPGVPAEFGTSSIPEASWGLGFMVVVEQKFPYFMGGLIPPGTVCHPGAGGLSYWIDFENDIVGVWAEVVTELTELTEPLSTSTHIFQDVITAAVER